MSVARGLRRFGDRDDAFGFLRLVLAAAVIVSHTPNLVDGDARRDPVILALGGGGLTLGGLAVSAFFIISGYLITASFEASRDWTTFIRKRIARIYPAFLLMYLLCFLVVRPLGGGAPGFAWPVGLGHEVVSAVLLRAPNAADAFTSSPSHLINGAVWTIQYEFKCYLLVLALGLAGLLRRAPLIACLSLACLLGALAPDTFFEPLYRLPRPDLWLGWPREGLRMTGLFLAGATFHLVRRRIVFSRRLILASAVALVLCLRTETLPNIGLAIFGSYLVFAAARAGGGTFLRSVNARTDISYGLYIYAWPIEQLLLRAFGGSSLILLGGGTLALAALAGWLSWVAVERPAMRLARDRRPRRSPASLAPSLLPAH